MGKNAYVFYPSPYIGTSSFAWSKTHLRSNHTSLDNPLRWDRALLNFPKTRDSNPEENWVQKFNKVINKIAEDMLILWMMSGLHDQICNNMRICMIESRLK